MAPWWVNYEYAVGSGTDPRKDRWLNVGGNRGARTNKFDQLATNSEVYLENQHYLTKQAVLVLGVQMTDAQGAAWLATYQLERQPDGILLIDGCELVANEGHYT